MFHCRCPATNLSTIFFAIVLHCGAAAAFQDRPNILVIMTDQHSSAQMTQRGYPHIATPGIDQLAANGIAFTRAYTTYPLCRSSRLSLFTGRMPSEARQGIDDVYPSLLRTQGGYETAYFGKWHVGTTLIDKTRTWHKLETYEIQHNDTKTREMAIDFLEKYAFRQRQRNRRARYDDNENKVEPQPPFLMVASFLNPHDCVETARRIAGGGPKDGIAFSDKAVNYQQDLSQCPPLPFNFQIPANETQAFAIRRGAEYGEHDWRKLPTKYWNTTQWRQYLYAYNRLLEMADAHVLALRSKLESLNLLEDTVIVYLSDHGSGRGSHQWTAKQTFYEETVGVPFILSWKGHMLQEPGYIDNTTLVSTGLDLFPTLLSLANVQLPKDHPDGGMDLTTRSFVGAKQTNITSNHSSFAPPRSLVVSEFNVRNTKGANLTGRMLVTDPSLSPQGRRLKYMLFDGGTFREQLFDLDADPGEVSPVTMNSSHEDDLLACQEALQTWVQKRHDDDFVVQFPPRSEMSKHVQ